MKKYLLIIGMSAVLAACGGSGGDGAVANPGGSNPPPMSTVDAFFTRVMALIGSSSDNTEPVAVDSVSPTTPEDSEPSPLS
ncbi:MAG TPA: hypothetical protein VGU61_10600 [Noviherbaspirillum sp.]|jgi:hypothetical protein|uniref:hypothetical protein n=1 Tax=Noviherbaspirillum sp. TaxID=1926288 RepID=UPI002DDD42D0|nr:hypothetical protein [Noviherbaspirillum sp.]HEV2610704.1 hypothetical protein [Noviherbaspirillum sp.]